jgi:DivIVA domain-containing protein
MILITNISYPLLAQQRRSSRRKVRDMPLTPEEVSRKKFTIVHRRGYDQSEVEQYLGLVAEDYNAAIQRIGDAAGGMTEDDIASEVGELLRTARDAARRIKEKARIEAESMLAKAQAEAATQIEQSERRRNDILQRAEAEATNKLATAERQKSQAVELIKQRTDEMVEHEKKLRSRVDELETLVTELRVVLDPVEIDLLDDESALMVSSEDDEVARPEPVDGTTMDIRELQRQARRRMGEENAPS